MTTHYGSAITVLLFAIAGIGLLLGYRFLARSWNVMLMEMDAALCSERLSAPIFARDSREWRSTWRASMRAPMSSSDWKTQQWRWERYWSDDVSENDIPVDSTMVTWAFDFGPFSLPEGAVYAAGLTRELGTLELRIVDLLYSQLDSGWSKPARQEYLKVMDAAADDVELFAAAQKRMLELNKMALPAPVYVNIIEGSDDQQRTVYAIVGFYLKEEVKNGELC